MLAGISRRYISLVLSVLLVLCVGGYTFSLIESGVEKEIRADLAVNKKEFIEKYNIDGILINQNNVYK